MSHQCYYLIVGNSHAMFTCTVKLHASDIVWGMFCIVTLFPIFLTGMWHQMCWYQKPAFLKSHFSDWNVTSNVLIPKAGIFKISFWVIKCIIPSIQFQYHIKRPAITAVFCIQLKYHSTNQDYGVTKYLQKFYLILIAYDCFQRQLQRLMT